MEVLRILVYFYDNFVDIFIEYIDCCMYYFSVIRVLLRSFCKKYIEEEIIGFGF